MSKKQLLIEKLKREQMKVYRKDPMLWLEERFGEDRTSFEWSKFEDYAKHKWDGDEDPLVKAWYSLAEWTNVAIESGTGLSKTYWLSRVVYWFLDCFEDALVVTSAPKESQLTLNLWAEIGKSFYRFKAIRQSAELFKLRLKVDGVDKKNAKRVNQFSERRYDEVDYTDSWQAVGFVAGTGADEDSANNARGMHRKYMLIICEETPGISKAVLNAFENTASGQYNLILAVGNPDSKLDNLHTFAMRDDVDNYRISAFDYPNIVLKREVFPGGTSIKSIKSRESKYGKDSGMYNRMVRGIAPTQGREALIKLEWIEGIINKEMDYGDYDYNALGMDVANSEAGDKASLAWGRGKTLVKLQTFQCNNATHLAYNVIMSDAELEEKGYEIYNTDKVHDYDILHDCIGVDAVGVGVATVNAFVDYNYQVTALQGGEWVEAIPKDEEGRPLYKFASLRAQMYWELREDIRNGYISFNIDDLEVLERLKEELISPKFMSQGNVIAVEKKQHIQKRLGRSPDIADAVVYWNWVRKGYKKQLSGVMFA